MSVAINGTNGVTFNDGSAQNTAATGFGFKNRIINGAMVIDQRNAGASVTASTTGSNIYLVDRWCYNVSQASKFTAQQNAGAVTPPAGFTNYLGFTSSSAYSVLTADYFVAGQVLEGLNVSDLGWGTASAATVTLSFWVRSSLTGTFGGALSNSAQNRSYPFSYTISSANTWEQKTITIAGDTTGTWLTTNGIGVRLWFGLGVGTTYSGTAGSWSGSTFLSATGATNVIANNGATFYITGVQLEKGSTATSFDVRDYGTELMLCQRYYEKSYAQSTAPGTVTSVGASVTYSQSYASGTLSGGAMVIYKATKRSTPTVVAYSTITGASGKLRDSATGADVNANESNGGENSTFLYGASAIATTTINFQFQWTASAEL